MADIKVNAADWNQLSAEHKSQITSIIKDGGYFQGIDKIVGDETAPPAAEMAQAAADHLQASAEAHRAAAGALSVSAPQFQLPKFVCDIAEAGAVAACALVPAPGNVVCVAVAHAAGEYCRSHSKP